MKRLKLLLFGIFLSSYHTIAQTLSDTEAKTTWNELQKQPLTEQSFRKACDLIQDTGKSNLNLSYAWLKDYIPKVQAAGQWQWAHMLLMAWARAKESFGVFDESEILYQKTLRNAPLNSEQYREALVGLVFLYNHWEKADSSAKYLALGEASARAANDRENLAFFYTLHAAYHIPPNDVKSRENFYRQAIKLTEGLNDKNAEFTARYNFVVNFLDENPAQQVAEAEALLELAKDSSLTRRPRFYERSNFWFRNPIPTLYFYMLQQNLILADNSNANQFADLLNEVVIKPNLIPTQTPFFTTQMAFTKATIGQYKEAKNYLKQTQTLLQLPEKDIPFPNYFTAAGLIAEYEKRPQSALLYHQQALEKGSTAAFYFMPAPLYYAHALTLTGAFEKAKNILQTFDTLAHSRPYSATGLYYYQYLAELEKARGLLPQHLQHLQTYHTIKDSLTNLNRYRAIQQVLAKVGLREKEQQVVRLNKEKNARELQIKRERLLYGAIISTAVLAIVFLMLYLRNRQIRNRQTLELKQAELEQLKKQRHIYLIKGIMEAEENERRKVADQLHDEVNSSLALVSLNVSSVLEKGLTDVHSEPKLTKAYEVLGNVSTTIRNISHRLTPLLIERYGFGHAVQDLADTVNLSGKLHLDTLVIGIEENPHYSISFLHDVFKIIQELIQNTLKHAQATEAFVEVVEQPDHTLSVMVEDNGLGLKPFPPSEGKGLSSIRAKVKYLGGKIEIQNAPNGGTLVVIEHLVPRSE